LPFGYLLYEVKYAKLVPRFFAKKMTSNLNAQPDFSVEVNHWGYWRISPTVEGTAKKTKNRATRAAALRIK